MVWAKKGWEVDDRLELVRVIRYGPMAGSDITVRRTNEVLADNGISELILLIKVPSNGCTIERLIALVDNEGTGGCLFYETYIDQLTDLGIDVEIPLSCGP